MTARLTASVAVVVAAAACAAAASTGIVVQDERVDARAKADALAVGRETAVAFTSYDYRHLDTDLAEVADRATGPFRGQFTTAMGALTQAITDAKGISVGRVVSAGLVEGTRSTATVIAAVDASITNTESPTATTRRYRLKITLDHSSGAWLITQIEPVS